MTVATEPHELIADDPAFYAELVTIKPKVGSRIPFVPNTGQIALTEALLEQHNAGKPMRAVILKARQIGFSTLAQLMMVQRCTTRQGHQAVTIAHDKKTGGKLFRMGDGIRLSLPDETYVDADGIERPLRVPVRSYRRKEYLHFAQPDTAAWLDGTLWPDSEYDVDTAGDFDAGRGGTYHSIHASEVAFWGDAESKLAALKSAVPSMHDTLFLVESTANGHNVFYNEWQTAVNDPDSEYIAFFWPWFKHDEYRKPFVNAGERERFTVGDGPWGEEEPKLVERFGVDLEQLNWRRYALSNLVAGESRQDRIATFHAEYPSTPEEAFIGTGSHVFDSEKVSVLIQHCEAIERGEVEGIPAPVRGKLVPTRTEEMETRGGGTIEAPLEPKVVFEPDLPEGERAPWTFWCERSESGLIVPPSAYLVSADVAGDESEEEGGDSAFHAIEVIDHFTGEQIAEYASRGDAHYLIAELYMAAQLFCAPGMIPTEEGAWISVERTGGWGLPVLHALAKDLWYPRIYRSRRRGQRGEKPERKYGWETSPRTKPTLITLAQKLLRLDETGIRSAPLAREMQTYIRDERGRTKPERGAFADRLMAWMIDQQLRQEIPPDDIEGREEPDEEPAEGGGGPIQTWAPRDRRTGY